MNSPKLSWLRPLLWLTLAFLSLVAAGAWHARWQFVTRGIPTAAPLPTTGAGVQYGVNVYLTTYSDDELDTHLGHIAAAGFTYIKQPFYFQASFDWAESDRLFAAAHRHNLSLIPLLDGDPTTQFAPPSDPALFAQWAGLFARRYGEGVDAYIIWDEPNLTTHWGNLPVNPDEYSALLAAAAQAIRVQDSTALIVAAPLAPTVETGPKNIADHLYLQAMYEAGAAPFFDIAAGKPYGFNHGPNDRTVHPDRLNFSRIILLREVMERNGDSHKAVWAGNWGWNALPPDWSGSPSLWGETDEAAQRAWTVAGWQRARWEWPWMGVMFLENWQPDAPADDPRWGFSVQRWATPDLFSPETGLAFPGFHLADGADPAQAYSGGWRFSPEFGADISQSGDSVTFTFWGTDVAVRVRRADFRARLYVTVDGQPANALPRDENGTTLVLTAPDPAEEYLAVIWLAHDLPPGPHQVTLVADRGWDQWALNGFSVLYRPDDRGYRWGVVAWLAAALLFSALAIRTGWVTDWGHLGRMVRQGYARLGQAGQLFLTGLAGSLLALSGWLTWGAQMEGMYRRLGDGGQMGVTFAAAFLFYVAPTFYLYSLALLVLALCVYLRPAWGLALIAAALPFRLVLSKTISSYSFSLLEIFTLLTFVVVLGRWVRLRVGKIASRRVGKEAGGRWAGADYAVLGLVLVGTVSLFFTERLDVATNEWRWLILEPALFYAAFRLTPLNRREIWTIVDGFVLGAVLMSLIGLAQYVTGSSWLITAEGGLMRLRSVYGSPNNVALYLGRVLPLVVTVGGWGIWRQVGGWRCWGYGAAALIMLLTFLLTYSKGGLFLGLPAAFLIIFLIWQRHSSQRLWPWLVGAAIVGLIGLVIALQIPALAGRLNPQITGFFRVYLWRASLEMVREHPWFGVGLDNFLYAYRGRYIFNAAWQEPNLNHPHNLILDFATRLGVVGLLMGGWLFGEYTRLVWRWVWPRWGEWESRGTRMVEFWPLGVGLAGSLAYMLAHGLVDHGYFLVDLAFAFHLQLALLLWVKEGVKSEAVGG